MGIAEEIKQKKFKNEFSKAVVNLLFTNNWLHEQQMALFKPYDLTIPQYNVLRILRGQYPAPATISSIIERMLDRMSNASRIVDRLEKKKLVSRTKSDYDRRAVDVVISDKGLALLEQIDQHMDQWENEIRGLTDDEARQLNDLLDKFREQKEEPAPFASQNGL